MSTSVAEFPAPLPVAARPEAEPRDQAASFAGPRALEMVVEMAHDLRSPLTSILFLAESMQDGRAGPVTETQRRQLGLIRNAALCLCASASDVMELARGDRLAQTTAAPFSVLDVFTAVRDMVQPLAEEKGLELRFRPLEQDRRLGSERALARALLNLTTNALKYTERGHVEIAARAKSATRVEFVVRDTGPGMTDDALQALYQPFHQVANARLRFSSAGLGLSIVRKVVEAMGAELRVMTREGTGTRFWFEVELPLAGEA